MMATAGGGGGRCAVRFLLPGGKGFLASWPWTVITGQCLAGRGCSLRQLCCFRPWGLKGWDHKGQHHMTFRAFKCLLGLIPLVRSQESRMWEERRKAPF